VQSMKKRLTEGQFHEAVKGLKVGEQTLEIARGVLIDGKPQADFVAQLGLSRGAVSQAVDRVWSAHQAKNLPAGVRAGIGSIAGTPGFHCEKVGRGRHKETGTH
jgi:hypothetical protein